MNMREFRRKVDTLDDQLVRLLNERTRLAVEIGNLKDSAGAEAYVPVREREVLDRLRNRNAGPLAPESLEAIYREIMSAALSLQRGMGVAYLGPPATFTHQAARRQFGASVSYLPVDTIRDVFSAVERRTAACGVVPVENSTDGAVTHTLDEFANTRLKICAEIYLPISHHLMSRAPRERIRRVYSKPEVFGQSRRWLLDHMPEVEQVPVAGTAHGAKRAAEEADSGAIAGALAAELYGLTILAEDIQGQAGDTTRFLVIGRNFGPRTGRDRTSVCFAVKDRVGALHRSLETFTKHGINMKKIESRPGKARAWEYVFFVDVDGHVDEPRVRNALDEMADHCSQLTVLGAFPRAAEGP